MTLLGATYPLNLLPANKYFSSIPNFVHFQSHFKYIHPHSPCACVYSCWGDGASVRRISTSTSATFLSTRLGCYDLILRLTFVAVSTAPLYLLHPFNLAVFEQTHRNPSLFCCCCKPVCRYDPQLLALVSERPVEYLPLFEEAVREALAKLVPASEADDLPDFQVLVNSDQVRGLLTYKYEGGS